ncbi:NADH-ubiquinone oxidoreductase chain 1, partial [Armadillidium nasatum]
VYHILGAGWSYNSKYSILGRLRAVAQNISYEVRLAIIILRLVALNSSFQLTKLPSCLLPRRGETLNITPINRKATNPLINRNSIYEALLNRNQLYLYTTLGASPSIDRNIEEQPYYIYKMPVPCSGLKSKMKQLKGETQWKKLNFKTCRYQGNQSSAAVYPLTLKNAVEKMSKVKEGGSSQNLILFIRGKAISGAPNIKGINQFPKPPIIIERFNTIGLPTLLSITTNFGKNPNSGGNPPNEKNVIINVNLFAHETLTLNI